MQRFQRRVHGEGERQSHSSSCRGRCLTGQNNQRKSSLLEFIEVSNNQQRKWTASQQWHDQEATTPWLCPTPSPCSAMQMKMFVLSCILTGITSRQSIPCGISSWDASTSALEQLLSAEISSY